jgi:hypothetical protein
MENPGHFWVEINTFGADSKRVDARALLLVESPIVTDAAFDMKGGKRPFAAHARASCQKHESGHPRLRFRNPHDASTNTGMSAYKAND